MGGSREARAGGEWWCCAYLQPCEAWVPEQRRQRRLALLLLRARPLPARTFLEVICATRAPIIIPEAFIRVRVTGRTLDCIGSCWWLYMKIT